MMTQIINIKRLNVWSLFTITYNIILRLRIYSFKAKVQKWHVNLISIDQTKFVNFIGGTVCEFILLRLRVNFLYESRIIKEFFLRTQVLGFCWHIVYILFDYIRWNNARWQNYLVYCICTQNIYWRSVISYVIAEG